MNRFQDHFSAHASDYAAFRPRYPDGVGSYLADLCFRRSLAWEAGCGSGQFTRVLAGRFERIHATDASAEQLAHAPALSHVEYRCARAEASELADTSVDLAVAAQSAHWFDLPGYYREIRRTGRPGAVVALLTYTLMRMGEPLDDVVRSFYHGELEAHWPPQRRLVEDGYQTLWFPFDEIESPAFEIEERWTLEQALGYIASWSAVRALLRTGGSAALDRLRSELTQAWGAVPTRTIRWPLGLRVGRI